MPRRFMTSSQTLSFAGAFVQTCKPTQPGGRSSARSGHSKVASRRNPSGRSAVGSNVPIEAPEEQVVVSRPTNVGKVRLCCVCVNGRRFT